MVEKKKEREGEKKRGTSTVAACEHNLTSVFVAVESPE